MKIPAATSRTLAEYKRLHSLLLREQAHIQERLREINNALFSQPEPAPKSERTPTAPAPPKRKAKTRGSIVAQIELVLKAAGSKGLSIGEILEQTPGLKKGSLNVWFYTTGKKHPNIKKVGAGRFAWID